MTLSIKKALKKIKLWDGTNEVDVNASNELQTRDDDSNTTLENINGKLVNGNDIGDVTVNNTIGSAVPVTQFDSAGNEGQKIIGIDYLAGNSGIDASTETLQQISYEHHEIHSGSHYNYCDYALNQSGSAVIEFVLTTPDTAEWLHLVFIVSSSDGATIELYEGASGITGGTSITPRNNNRNSDNTSNVTIVKDPSAITSDGVRASGYLAGGSKTAGVATRDNEFVLKQDEIYLVRISSLATSNDIAWCAEWYEHTDKN